ncbi:DJ-1/PfpI family protein, partial [Teichococcus deserti]|uniref:DJ-1/PfpI family protein n=1 Tax=Teichococcus deserti TaxID=1817963 RepID=UPI001A9687D9
MTDPQGTPQGTPQETRTRQVNILLVPRMVQLDMAGPFEVLARVPGWSVTLVAASLEPVRTDRGLRILPDATRETAPAADLLVVPGGGGVDATMLDPAWIDFVRRQAAAA